VFVRNRVSASIIDRIPAECWRHVQGSVNPADFPSRGMFPQELIHCKLWWDGPPWLKLESSEWPNNPIVVADTSDEETIMLCVANIRHSPLIPYDRYSSFIHLVRVTCWIFHFLHNCRLKCPSSSPHLLSSEIHVAACTGFLYLNMVISLESNSYSQALNYLIVVLSCPCVPFLMMLVCFRSEVGCLMPSYHFHRNFR
jgi:hypothetical protein